MSPAEARAETSPPPPRDLRRASAAELRDLSGELFAALAPRIAALGRRFYGRREGEVEELVAETFARVLSALPRFQGRSSYATWVTRIAMNVIGEDLRRHSLARLANPASDDPTASERLRNQERASLIQDALEALGPEHRMVLSLVALEGLPRAEAAELLGVAEGTVWSRYARARLALAREFRLRGIE